MAFFSKKTTLVHNITYMAIMVAINLIFIVLDTYVPFLMFLLVLLLPFVSALVSYFCDKRYYIIYAVASVGLCLIFNIADTLFYIVPSLCSGFFIGLLLNKKIHPFWMVLSSTLIEVLLSYAFIPLIKLLTNVDIVTSFLAIFKLNDFAYKQELMHIVILFMALTQCSLTHFVLLTEIRKLGIQTDTHVASFAPYIIGLQVTLIVGLIFALTYTPPSIAIIGLSYYFAIFLFVELLMTRKVINYILLGVSLIIAFFIFVIVYSKIVQPLGFIYFSLFPLAIAIISFINYCLAKSKTYN